MVSDCQKTYQKPYKYENLSEILSGASNVEQAGLRSACYTWSDDLSLSENLSENLQTIYQKIHQISGALNVCLLPGRMI